MTIKALFASITLERRMRKIKKKIVDYVFDNPGVTEVDISNNCNVSKKSLLIDDLMERGEIIGIPSEIYISDNMKPLKRTRFFPPRSWAERVKIYREVEEKMDLQDESPYLIKHRKENLNA